MNRFAGLFLCTLSLAALLLPLPVLHFHDGANFHIGSFTFQSQEAATCEFDTHQDQHDNEPPCAHSSKNKKPGLWVVSAPATPSAHALPTMNLPPVVAPPAIADRTAPRPVSRGPPRSILALYCILRV